MKDEILKLIELSKHVDIIKANLDAHVKKVAIIWAKANELKWDGRDNPSDEKSIDSWSIENELVEVKWEEFRAYGAHASGDFSFHPKYLYEGETLNQFVKDCEAIKVARDGLKAEQERQKDLNQFQVLQKKLGIL